VLVDITSTQEQALIARAKRQDEDAFRKLFDAYFPAIYAYIASQADRQQDAEDIVQNAFSKVVAGLPNFDYRGAGSFRAWLFQIASSQINDFYRKHKRANGHIPLDSLPELRSQSMPAEEIADLNMLIDRLSPRRREVMQLKQQGLSNQEIAQKLDLDERTVSSHFRKGLKDLAKLYRSET
jgi:RNA polymerase sigma-70 factor (ECF subfamily)